MSEPTYPKATLRNWLPRIPGLEKGVHWIPWTSFLYFDYLSTIDPSNAQKQMCDKVSLHAKLQDNRHFEAHLVLFRPFL